MSVDIHGVCVCDGYKFASHHLDAENVLFSFPKSNHILLPVSTDQNNRIHGVHIYCLEAMRESWGVCQPGASEEVAVALSPPSHRPALNLQLSIPKVSSSDAQLGRGTLDGPPWTHLIFGLPSAIWKSGPHGVLGAGGLGHCYVQWPQSQSLLSEWRTLLPQFPLSQLPAPSQAAHLLGALETSSSTEADRGGFFFFFFAFPW